jgi:alpha-tubulin suppressor-like RCC1 family protein
VTWTCPAVPATALAALAAMFALNPAVAGAAPAGQLYAAGWDEYGQLGNGRTGTSPIYEPIPGLSSVAQASPGHEASLALLADGTVDAFGHNESGELGDGTTEQHDTPQPVPGLADVTAVAAGAYGGYALRSNGTVEAWGSDRYGQLGDAKSNVGGCSCVKSPVQVKGVDGVGSLSGVVAISAGSEDAMALLSDGTVVDWGYGHYGELGDGQTVQSDVPVRVAGVGGFGTLSNVVAISAGAYDNLALLSDGTVVAWGYNDEGELGDGETTQSDVPVQVKGAGGSGTLSGVSAISAGVDFSLALLSNGTVYGWGYNLHHELGDGETTPSYTPVQVPGLSDVSAIAAGGYFGQALLTDGSLYGWGDGEYGELGNGSDGEIALPRQMTFPGSVFALGHGDENSQSLIVQGTTASVSRTSIAFAGQLVGTHSASRTVTVENAGPAPLTVSGDVLSGSGEFAVTSSTCAAAPIPAGATCSISVVFSPTASGEAKGTLSVSSTAVSQPPVISLTGTGVTSAQLTPELGGLRLSASAFRAAGHGPSIVNVIAPGTVVSYTDSEAGITTFTVEQAVGGVLAGSGSSARCISAPRHPRLRVRRCVFYRTIGSFAHLDRAGANRFRFTGRVKGRELTPGSYRLIIVAHSASGRSAARTVRFRIVARWS